MGSLNLTAFVRKPFSAEAYFDTAKMAEVTRIAVRMLDNVLDVTNWPLPEQAAEAASKRRVGLGFTGLGDALVMLGLRYDTAEARAFASQVAKLMRDVAYSASVELAEERGAFPLFDAEKYLAAGYASRLPADIKARIAKTGIRNSHLTSIAPTGTISLAFADNASNGIEPAFSWVYTRKKRMPDGSKKEYQVEDHAYRVYREMGGDTTPGKLPPAFVSALEISALDHMNMVAAVAPFVDSAISKTVNVPEDYPFEDFKDLYLAAWKAGLKGITTYRPNSVLGSVLSVAPEKPAEEKPETVQLSARDRRLVLAKAHTPVLDSLRWPSRPSLPAGASCWVSDVLETPVGDFVAFVSDVEGKPFEVWVNGARPPAALGAVAKTLSMDMRANDRKWLRLKLDALLATNGSYVEVALPPTGERVKLPSLSAALARLVEFRCTQLGALDLGENEPTPVLDAVFAQHEPLTGPDGTMGWVVDIANATAGDNFVMTVKELQMPDGSMRPYSLQFAGTYPKAMDGLAKLLSLDMRVVDPAWIGMKLRKLLNYTEPGTDFMARVPGGDKQVTYPSTVAYVATLLLHRYAMLGILNNDGRPVVEMGVMQAEPVKGYGHTKLAGKVCRECGEAAVIKQGGCEVCSNCGAVGSCG